MRTGRAGVAGVSADAGVSSLTGGARRTTATSSALQPREAGRSCPPRHATRARHAYSGNNYQPSPTDPRDGTVL